MRFLLCLSATALLSAAPNGSSVRGARLFESQGCLFCHRTHAAQGQSAPDLSQTIARDQTPAALAATMWNHAPVMWSAIKAKELSVPKMNEQQAADLFAHFAARRFFDKPGDAGRGKAVFTTKRCADCHGVSETKVGPPLTSWRSLESPTSLAESMWNHAAKMNQEFQKKKLAWPQLSEQDLSDLLVYIRRLPRTARVQTKLEIAASSEGEALLKSKGCEQCHAGSLALPLLLKGKSLTGIAASMWNHAPNMSSASISFQPGEMNQLLSFLWARSYFEDSGSANAGKRAFVAKGCAGCHEQGSAPKLTGKEASSVSMVAGLWQHGPAMLEQMRQKKVMWPRFTAKEMQDLVAYLNSRR